MKNKSKVVTTLFFSFIGIIILGTLFHFAFEFLGCNTLIGAFTPVNESIWEHLKLILIPSLLMGLLEYFAFGKHYVNYFYAKSLGTVLGMLTVLIGYYTYSGIIGNDYLIVDIILFIIGAAVAVLSEYRLLFSKSKITDDTRSIIGMMLITLVILIFMYFTFNPPMLELFRDPFSGDFGISEYCLY